MRLKRKHLTLMTVLGALGIAFSTGQAHAASWDGQVKVQVNDGLVNFPDAQPYIDSESRLQVPLRFVSETLGFKVDWKMAGGQVQVALGKDRTSVQLATGDKTVSVNGKKAALDSAPAFTEGRVYVPLRFITDTLGIRIQWDDLNRIAILDKDAKYHAPAWYAPKMSDPIDALATAYTAQPSENGGWKGLDYMGNSLKLGTIAVDPSVIPLGTKIWVTGYDYDGLPKEGFMATASDIGSAIKGNRIDIFIPESKDQVIGFGKQDVKLYRTE